MAEEPERWMLKDVEETRGQCCNARVGDAEDFVGSTSTVCSRMLLEGVYSYNSGIPREEGKLHCNFILYSMKSLHKTT